MNPLSLYENARFALAEVHRVDEVKDLRDKAEAMACYARQAKDSELIQYATEIKVRAERRCGELLAAADKHEGGRPPANRSDDATGLRPPTLADMGLTKDESSRYQQLASMPAEAFEAAVETAKEVVGEVTTAFLLRQARQLNGAPSSPAQRQTRTILGGWSEVDELRRWAEEIKSITGQPDMESVKMFVVKLMEMANAHH